MQGPNIKFQCSSCKKSKDISHMELVDLPHFKRTSVSIAVCDECNSKYTIDEILTRGFTMGEPKSVCEFFTPLKGEYLVVARILDTPVHMIKMALFLPDEYLRHILPVMEEALHARADAAREKPGDSVFGVVVRGNLLRKELKASAPMNQN